MGFLDEDDRVVMNLDHLTSAAKREVLDLLADGYAPPIHDKPIYAPGKVVRAAIEASVIKTLLWDRYATEYDASSPATSSGYSPAGTSRRPNGCPRNIYSSLRRGPS